MAPIFSSRTRKLLGGVGSVFILLACIIASVLFGSKSYELSDLWQAYVHFNGSNEHLILTNSRVPRALIGAIVGASLAMAGAIMQVLTKNPLASPSVLGINSGAVLFLMIFMTVFHADLTMNGMIWVAFAGAMLTGTFVFLLGSQGRGGFEPIKLTLAGASIAAFASSIMSGIILTDRQSLESALFWMVGSIVDRQLNQLVVVFPYVVIGWLLAMLLSGSLNVIALGDEMAKGLGQRIVWVRVLSAVTVMLLAGGSVAVAGPIAFVGIIVPHLCRALVGNDHRWLLPYCALVGAILLVSADLASRFIIMPKEVPVGVAMALLGVPFLIYVARRRAYD